MEEKKELIPERNNTPMRPVYHASVPSGWGNDPNGLCFFRGAYHMFYQYNPHDTVWGPMHWGHMVSCDLIHWEDLPVALFPDRPWDLRLGCFSGSALVKDGRLYVIYTGVSESAQQQCMAFSDDGIHFEKYDCPVIPTALVPPGAPKDDFRDPSLFERDGIFYCLVGTRIGEKGNIALYRSDDLVNFSFVGMLFPDDGTGLPMEGICECPDTHFLNGYDLLIFSPQHTFPFEGRFQNPQSSVYMTGKLDLSTGRFSVSHWDEIDFGSDFYAPQAMDLPDGRCVMIGWKEMWGRSMPTSSEGWAGSYTVPRELSVADGKLLQAPAEEVKQYFRKSHAISDKVIAPGDPVSFPGVRGRAVRLRLEMLPGKSTKCGIRLFCLGDHHVRIFYDSEKKCVTADRSRQGMALRGNDIDVWTRSAPAQLRDGTITLDILLDTESMEIFVNGGERALAMNVYTKDPSADGIEFFSEGALARMSMLEQFVLS